MDERVTKDTRTPATGVQPGAPNAPRPANAPQPAQQVNRPPVAPNGAPYSAPNAPQSVNAPRPANAPQPEAQKQASKEKAAETFRPALQSAPSNQQPKQLKDEAAEAFRPALQSAPSNQQPKQLKDEAAETFRPLSDTEKKLSVAVGAVSIVCSVLAVLSLVLLLCAIIPNSHNWRAVIVFLAAILSSFVFIGATMGDLVIGVILTKNLAVNDKRYTGAAVFGIIDVLAFITVILNFLITKKVGGGWFIIFAFPFIIEFVLKIVCAVICNRKTANTPARTDTTAQANTIARTDTPANSAATPTQGTTQGTTQSGANVNAQVKVTPPQNLNSTKE